RRTLAVGESDVQSSVGLEVARRRETPEGGRRRPAEVGVGPHDREIRGAALAEFGGGDHLTNAAEGTREVAAAEAVRVDTRAQRVADGEGGAGDRGRQRCGRGHVSTLPG